MKYKCLVCGQVFEVKDGETPVCPVCKASGDKVVPYVEEELVWADEHKIGVAQGLDPEIVQGLRDNFQGECSEVGMYLAMSRQAFREGYPEIGVV
ncbi:MAG: NADH peroxidase, partial [Bacilli bacterium]|nr:NADH peroxidase [Bacilli bacterium]MDY6009366.1 NADH peroxidase [Bacilli bacterium]